MDSKQKFVVTSIFFLQLGRHDICAILKQKQTAKNRISKEFFKKQKKQEQLLNINKQKRRINMKGKKKIHKDG